MNPLGNFMIEALSRGWRSATGRPAAIARWLRRSPMFLVDQEQAGRRTGTRQVPDGRGVRRGNKASGINQGRRFQISRAMAYLIVSCIPTGGEFIA